MAAACSRLERLGRSMYIVAFRTAAGVSGYEVEDKFDELKSAFIPDVKWVSIILDASFFGRVHLEHFNIFALT